MNGKRCLFDTRSDATFSTEPNEIANQSVGGIDTGACYLLFANESPNPDSRLGIHMGTETSLSEVNRTLAKLGGNEERSGR
jgi:hypothetical protein